MNDFPWDEDNFKAKKTSGIVHKLKSMWVYDVAKKLYIVLGEGRGGVAGKCLSVIKPVCRKGEFSSFAKCN